MFLFFTHHKLKFELRRSEMKEVKMGFLYVCKVGIFCFLLASSGCVSREAYLQKSSSGQIGCGLPPCG
jgi:hypothetical protein